MLSLLIAIIVVTIVAIVIWAITEKIPDPTLKTVIRAVAILVMLLIFLRQFGGLMGLS
jgi:hypothetical protein